MRPAAIVADAYVSSQFLIYIIRGDDGDNRPSEYLNPTEYFSTDFISRLAAHINIIFAIFKVLALCCVIIVGMAQLLKPESKSHWANLFNDTISDQRTSLEKVGSYGDAMLEILFTYEGWNNANYLTDLLNNPQHVLAVSNIFSILIATILYIFTNIAYITVVNPTDIILLAHIDDPTQFIAIAFGNSLLGEIGKKLMGALIVISSCGA
ncbi:7365_t:CDS:2 [Cetraspora pellucida]|uniref:7365_t:CDS:1 n=1 Tax=Cetraspora pellucida TaxID=1433469 RepID=A0A9N9EH49_9GLOM|nr:7365_t:CDS:2 [Cetraspora pellucida]